jgi:hypothetical protein
MSLVTMLKLVANLATAAAAGLAVGGDWPDALTAALAMLGGLLQKRPQDPPLDQDKQPILRVLLFLLLLGAAVPADAQNFNTIHGRRVERATLLADAAATGDGSWIAVEAFNAYTIHVSGITTATVIVNVSNAPAKPANNDHEIQAASVSADSIINVTMPSKWVKARVSSYSSGTINAYLEGVQQ